MSDDILLQNGSIGRFRPVEPRDRDELVALHAFLSDRRTYLRLVGLDTVDAGVFIDNLFRAVQNGEAYSEVCLVRDRLVGIGTYLINDSESAETVFVVDPRMHQLGIGTLLLERLADHAERAGIRDFVTRVLSSDSSALDVLARSGFTGTTFDVGGEIEIRFPISMTDRLANAVAERQGIANLASMNPLMRPRSVAVLARSLSPGSPGRTLLDRLSASGFSGPIYPIIAEPDDTVTGQSYRSIHDVPEPVDLVLSTLPADLTNRAAQNCADAGVRAMVIYSSGFADNGEHGRALQEEVLATTRTNGMRLIGPDSAGIMNAAPEIALDATTLDIEGSEPGPVALVTQSRSVGAAVLEQMGQSGIGISIFASLGNKADVSANDLLSFLAQDNQTSVITMFTESVGNPRRFSRITRSITRTKPVVAMVGSPYQETTDAVRTVETREPTVRELFRQCGVIHASSLEQLIDVTRFLADQPLPKGRRVAIISASRGFAAIAADALQDVQLRLAQFDQTLDERLTELVQADSITNPLLIDDESSIDTVHRLARAIADSGAADAVMVVPPRSAGRPEAQPEGSDSLANGETPVLTISLDPTATTASGVFRYPETAVRVLGAVADYAENRRSTPETLRDYDDLRPRAARELLTGVLQQNPEGRWLEADEIRHLLTCYGIDPVSTIESAGADQVLDAATWIGYPVVLKTPIRGIEHRLDKGGIRTNLATREAVATAYREMVTSGILADNAAVTVQRQVPTGMALSVGVVYDENFGPLVSFGTGERNAELFQDVVMCLTPVTEADAAATIRGARSSPLLFGYRGSDPIDTRAIEDLLQRVGRLADDQPALAELHLDVIGHSAGASVIDATAHVAPPGGRARLTDPLDQA